MMVGMAATVAGAAAPKLGHRRELDGLRGLAAVAVVVGHAFPDTSLLALYGVEVFFVLSGFLITTLMLEEHAATGRVGLRGFYVRRARRLFPALWLVAAVVAAAGLVAGSRDALAGAVGAFTYSTNLLRMEGVETGPLSHLWSLAVEEHFYVLWPLVVVAVGGRDRAVLRVALVAATASGLWRVTLADGDWFRMFLMLDTRAVSLLAGAALAAAVRLGLRGRTATVGWLVVAAGFLPALSARPELAGLFVCTIGTVLILLGVITRRSLWLGAPVLVWFGGISYALYLWHAVLMYLADDTTGRVLMGLVSVPVAYASTRWWEARWRGQRFSSQQPCTAAFVVSDDTEAGSGYDEALDCDPKAQTRWLTVDRGVLSDVLGVAKATQ